MSTRKTKNYLVDSHLKTIEKHTDEWPYYGFTDTKVKQYKVDTVLV
jgi:hypothetical protein